MKYKTEVGCVSNSGISPSLYRNMINFTFSLGVIFSVMLWQCCGPVGFSHKNHLVRARKSLWSRLPCSVAANMAANCQTVSLRYQIAGFKLSRHLLKNIQWFHAQNCGNAVSEHQALSWCVADSPSCCCWSDTCEADTFDHIHDIQEFVCDAHTAEKRHLRDSTAEKKSWLLWKVNISLKFLQREC